MKDLATILIDERWWFLGKRFAEFADDRLSQGYEVVARHPSFLDWNLGDCTRPKQGGNRPQIWPLEVVRKFPFAPSWTKLTSEQKRHFVEAFYEDLTAIKLIPAIHTHGTYLTIDCRDSSESITLGLQALLKHGIVYGGLSQLLKRQIKDGFGHFRINSISSNCLKFTPNPECSDYIDIDISPLLVQYRKRADVNDHWDYMNFVGSIETFLNDNCDYRDYQTEIRAKHTAYLAEMHEKYPDWASKALPGFRNRPPDPHELVLAFIAMDWQQAGLKLPGLISATKPLLTNFLGIRTCPLWRHRLDALYELHSKVKLPMPRRIVLPKRTRETAMSNREMEILGFLGSFSRAGHADQSGNPKSKRPW